MPNKAPLDYQINDLQATHPRVGSRFKKGRRAVEIRFPEKLFHQILSEAIQRQWSFSHMVRHLCEASIEGIE